MKLLKIGQIGTFVISAVIAFADNAIPTIPTVQNVVMAN